MKIIDSHQVNDTLNFVELIPAIRSTFTGPFGMPQRNVYELGNNKVHNDNLAVLPSWNNKGIAVKAFTHFPENPQKGYETLYSKVLLFSRETGEPIAVVDGTSLTYWRTAAVSALAADFLAKLDANHLLICGTGRLAPYMALAHASIRPIQTITIWGRDYSKAKQLAKNLQKQKPDLTIQPTDKLQSAIEDAEIISSATGAGKPIIHGDWVQPGTHTDFVGNHNPNRRECDFKLIKKAQVFVDSRENVLAEAGEILLPLQEGLISEDHIQAELAELCRGEFRARTNNNAITLFKAVGSALSDLAAALLVVEKLKP